MLRILGEIPSARTPTPIPPGMETPKKGKKSPKSKSPRSKSPKAGKKKAADAEKEAEAQKLEEQKLQVSSKTYSLFLIWSALTCSVEEFYKMLNE